jgi:hypothetical protein
MDLDEDRDLLYIAEEGVSEKLFLLYLVKSTRS